MRVAVHEGGMFTFRPLQYDSLFPVSIGHKSHAGGRLFQFKFFFV